MLEGFQILGAYNILGGQKFWEAPKKPLWEAPKKQFVRLPKVWQEKPHDFLEQYCDTKILSYWKAKSEQEFRGIPIALSGYLVTKEVHSATLPFTLHTFTNEIKL